MTGSECVQNVEFINLWSVIDLTVEKHAAIHFELFAHKSLQYIYCIEILLSFLCSLIELVTFPG